MSYLNKRKLCNARRTASIIVCVLVVILLVGMLTMQTVQTLALIRRGDDDRAKVVQARELERFAQSIDWNTAESQTLKMQIPDSVHLSGDPNIQIAILERLSIADNKAATRIVVRFPADQPGEVTTTSELDHE